MEHKSFPGRLQRNRCKCLSFPAAELIPQQPAAPAVSLMGRCGTRNHARGESQQDSARIQVPNIPAQTNRARAMQQRAGRTAADTGSRGVGSRRWLGGPRWSRRGSLPQPHPYRSSTETERPSTRIARSIKASLPALSVEAHRQHPHTSAT